jgi:hypothetical protein
MSDEQSGQPPEPTPDDTPTQPEPATDAGAPEEPTTISADAGAPTQRMPATPPPPPHPPAPPPNRTGWWFALAAVIIVVAGLVIGLLLADDDEQAGTGTSTTTLGTPTTTTVASTSTAAPTTTGAPTTTTPVTTPAPAIISFTGPDTVTCTAPTDIEVAWDTTNATGVTISRDGTEIASGGPSGSQSVEFPCDGAVHTYVLVAANADGATAQQQLTITQT